jgi:hypothetical protein
MAALRTSLFYLYEIGYFAYFLNEIRAPPLEARCQLAPRFGPFFGVVRGPRAAVAPQGSQGGAGRASEKFVCRHLRHVSHYYCYYFHLELPGKDGAWLWV